MHRQEAHVNNQFIYLPAAPMLGGGDFFVVIDLYFLWGEIAAGSKYIPLVSEGKELWG